MNGPRFSVRLGIIEGDQQFHAAGVDSAESLGCSQGIAVRVPTVIQPRLIVETSRLDDERVARPIGLSRSRAMKE